MQLPQVRDEVGGEENLTGDEGRCDGYVSPCSSLVVRPLSLK
ncbi:MAG: hypothetical protein EORIYHIE_001850, partial [Candidatus Fervidibacter sp.]